MPINHIPYEKLITYSKSVKFSEIERYTQALQNGEDLPVPEVISIPEHRNYLVVSNFIVPLVQRRCSKQEQLEIKVNVLNCGTPGSNGAISLDKVKII